MRDDERGRKEKREKLLQYLCPEISYTLPYKHTEYLILPNHKVPLYKEEIKQGRERS
jgi:hypothetical protein